MSAPLRVEVTWVDSCSNRSAWMTHDAAVAWGTGLECVSTGFLVVRNKHGITLAVSRTVSENEVSWGGIWFVPAGCIQKVRTIR